MGISEGCEQIKHKFVVIEWSQGCGEQHKDYSQWFSGSYVWYQMGAGFIGMITHLMSYVASGH